jgi:hypothetical protein
MAQARMTAEDGQEGTLHLRSRLTRPRLIPCRVPVQPEDPAGTALRAGRPGEDGWQELPQGPRA